MFMASVTYGQTLEHAKSVAKAATYGKVLVRRWARGLYDVYFLQETPIQHGQEEFIIRDTDRVLS